MEKMKNGYTYLIRFIPDKNLNHSKLNMVCQTTFLIIEHSDMNN